VNFSIVSPVFVPPVSPIDTLQKGGKILQKLLQNIAKNVTLFIQYLGWFSKINVDSLVTSRN
ncbi:MAG: hypothetical protein V3S05_03885, partial [Desulfobacterales bacterium]